MPSNPIVPDQFKAVIPAANSNICQKLLASLVTFPTLFYRWYSWAFNSDGTVSDDFKTAIGVTIGQLTAPGGVTASDGTYTDKVRIIWNPVVVATFYEVWRGPTNDVTAAALIGTTTAPVTTYDDLTVVPDQAYWFFIKAKTATDSSGFSTGDSGYSNTSGSPTTGSRIFTSNATFQVPSGVTTLEIEMWGAGGGGGGSGASYCYAGSNQYGGGGGGSGEYRKVKQIAVTALEFLTVIVDGVGGIGGHANGAGGKPSAGSGASGGLSSVRQADGTQLVTCFGGGLGFVGDCGATGGGGAAGTGGTSAGGTDEAGSPNPGTAGDAGLSANPYGAGGAGGAANNGFAAGGAGGSGTAGSNGQPGRVIITWPGPA